MGGPAFDSWCTMMLSLLSQDGVVYIGTVDHRTVNKAYARAGFFLYPTTYQETGCISVLRAMSAGAIPITSRLVESVLNSVTDGLDLGPATALNLTTAYNSTALLHWLSNDWMKAVVEAHGMDHSLLQHHRQRMMTFIRTHYTWSNTAACITDLFTLA